MLACRQRKFHRTLHVKARQFLRDNMQIDARRVQEKMIGVTVIAVPIGARNWRMLDLSAITTKNVRTRSVREG